ncbi:hypothetical protein EBR44_01495 [bacterium]|nr:hypothetical protein [bacterium]
MRRSLTMVFTAALMAAPMVASAQGAPAADEQSRSIKDGGVKVAGWKGMIDASEAKKGLTIENAKIASDGKDLRVTTGPASTYWNDKNTGKGDYSVMAKFTEPKFQNLNDHPHPYGLVIAGNDMGTENASYLYCSAYGNGTFIVRGFGPAAFQMTRRYPAAPSVNKAAGKDQPVSQDIAMTVKGNTVSCTINGAEVWTAPKDSLVMAGRLKSTDGAWGVRSGHNTEVVVSGLMVMKP